LCRDSCLFFWFAACSTDGCGTTLLLTNINNDGTQWLPMVIIIRYLNLFVDEAKAVCLFFCHQTVTPADDDSDGDEDATPAVSNASFLQLFPNT
jgi:hypothetical protein